MQPLGGLNTPQCGRIRHRGRGLAPGWDQAPESLNVAWMALEEVSPLSVCCVGGYLELHHGCGLLDGLREGALGQRPRQEGAGRLLCVPTWRHRKARKPDSPPALLQAVIPLRPRRALGRLVPHVRWRAHGLGPVRAMDGEEAPVLSECGSWGSVEPGSIFSSVEPERVPKLPPVSHSPRPVPILTSAGPSLPSAGRGM